MARMGSLEEWKARLRGPGVCQAGSVLHFTLVQFTELKKEAGHGSAPI